MQRESNEKILWYMFLLLSNHLEKKLMIKRESEKLAASKRGMRCKDISDQPTCTISPIVQSSPYIMSTCVSNIDQRTFIDQQRRSVIVPVSKWVVLPKSYTHCSDSFTAKLVYHMSFSNDDSSVSTLCSTDSL